MEPLSFWEQDIFPSRYDLIVVGAGIVGLSSALFYKQRNPNASVAVVERGHYPLGGKHQECWLCLCGINWRAPGGSAERI